jgi:hypothetical protein
VTWTEALRDERKRAEEKQRFTNEGGNEICLIYIQKERMKRNILVSK